MNNKILLLGAGRRVSFAERLKEHGLKPYSYELDDDAPIGNIAKLIKGKKWTDPYVYSDLKRVCMDEDIHVVLPMDDKSTTMAYKLTLNTFTYKIKTPACTPFIAEVCYNKQHFHSYFSNVFPHLYPSPEQGKRVILKPKNGFASKGISVVEYKDMPKNLCDSDLVAQRFIENGTEYTVDAYFDQGAKLVDCVPRERLRVAGGEVIDSITKRDWKIIKAVKDIASKLLFYGPVCFQFIRNETGLYIMEINARFGGGSILSMEAGFDMIQCMKEEYFLNKPISHIKGNWKNKFTMRRVYREFFYEDSSRP